MTQRTRKLVGTIVIILFVMVYGPIAMTLADSRIAELPGIAQALAYMVLGLVWVVPVLPLIKWMQKPDPDQA
ncbi:DUF2842 domain-containing protein [Salinarimonas chemoclinalis]|uniref:DUF2842 domain-containing protein n=1 Tax=Salinarimonas chemoclinalis TaxID=3241599 RepID=UPI003556C104